MTSRDKKGYFVISIDFELNWGVLDRKDNLVYQKNILAGRACILRTIELFKNYNINATIATVGLLFNSSKKQMIENIPKHKPDYKFYNGSPYASQIQKIGEDENQDKIHFGNSIIAQLKLHNNLEIASHTYSHYYTLDEGNDPLSFEEDLTLYNKVSSLQNCLPKSIVFPRNQVNEQYLKKCLSHGIYSYRGNEKSWMYEKGNTQTTGFFTRMIRILDAYFNLTGHNTYALPVYDKNKMTNIPSSRFFRPIRYGSLAWGIKVFSRLKLRRIKKAMSYAAKNNEVYHLWWHPHNFGKHQKYIFHELHEVLNHYKYLNEKYGMESKSMKNIHEIIKHG